MRKHEIVKKKLVINDNASLRDIQRYRALLQIKFWKTGSEKCLEKLRLVEDSFPTSHKLEGYLHEFISSKIISTKKLSGIYSFMSDEECIKALLNLSDNLEKKCNSKIATHGYEVCPIGGYNYPILTDPESYKKTAKDHALRNVLMESLATSGLSNGKVCQFFGVLPSDVFDKFMKEGVYFTEMSNGQILFHGKHAHMLHVFSTGFICAR